jgi:PAS domain-containing protein
MNGYTLVMRNAKLERRVEPHDRFHIAASRIGRVILRGQSREELLNNATRMLVESGGFSMAFIAWHDPDSRQLLPVARFGDRTGYSDRVRLYTDDRLEGQDPAGIAFRAGVPYVCNDLAQDERTLLWREASDVSSWLASAAVPIFFKGEPRGLLTVYTSHPGFFFGAEQVELLRDIADDIEFGLARIETEQRKRQAEEALSASQSRLQLDGTYAGFEPRIHPDDLPAFNRAVEATGRTKNTFMQAFRVIWPDGSIRWVVSRAEFSCDDAGVAIRMFGATLDLTAMRFI